MAQSITGVPDPIRVLYTDPDPAAREDVVGFLASDDRFTVETAPDVETAWGQLSETDVDCVVSEHDLPATNGVDFLERFREQYPDRPFLLYTADGTERIASEAVAAGVTEYLLRGDPTRTHTVLAERIAAAVEAYYDRLDATLRARAMEEAPFGITITDTTRPDDPLVYLNDRFEELTGYGEPAALGRNCRFLQGDGTAIEPVNRLRTAIDQGEPESVELLNYRQDGTQFWNRVTIAPLNDGEGTPEHFVGFQEDVSETVERDRRQKAVVRVLRELYEVTTDTECSFEDKIDRVLELGTVVLELPYGFLTEIDVSDDAADGVQTVVQSRGDHHLLQPGESCPLSRAYCRKTIETDGLLALQDAAEEGWAGDPAYETFDLGSYIGGKVLVDGELYGTLCFAATESRSSPFDRLERTLVRMISRWVSYELEHREATRALERQNERLEEFTSVVSHDVQNPLNVAQGRLQMAREDCDSEHLDDVADALDRIEALVTDLLELARHGDAATDPDAVDLGAVLEECWGIVETSHATLANRSDRTVRADENQLKQLLENLLGNAVEHGSTSPPSQAQEDAIAHNEPGVTITVGDLADGFYVEDDGSGIPTEERDAVFEAGYTRSADGTGFGLDIVQQVAENHGWTVTLTESDAGGARFEFTGVAFVDG
jgi:PAS domain S-box-containing protein